VLLVDDDQPDLLQWCEHRRARADAHARLARAQPHPFVVALALRQRRVQDRDHISEPRLEAPQRLRGQRDLGDEHDRGAPDGEHRFDGAQVHLGLARAGDTVQQQLGGRAPGDRREHLVERGALVARQRRRGRRCRADRVGARAPRARPVLDRDQPATLQASQRSGPELGRGRPSGSLERLQQLSLAVGEPGRRRLAVGRQRRAAGIGQFRGQHALGAPPLRGPGREHQRQRPRRRRAVLAGHPVGEPHELGRERGLEQLFGLRQLGEVELRAVADPVDDAKRPLAAEPDPQHRPDRHPTGEPVADPIVERAAHGAGAGQRVDLGDHVDRI
jgi:hypothetical protein